MSDHSKIPEDANPLLLLVLQLLRENPFGISEYDLLKKIETNSEHFAALANEAQLALFQKHFLVMNALYRLQDTLWREEQLWLSISPLRIALAATALDNSNNTQVAAHSDDALRTYYLDWQQFAATGSDDAANLLASFWTRYAALDQRDDALATLQLDSGADKEMIKRQYRRLAAATHPDRGGDAAQFLAVRAAYEVLREHK